ncbi:DMT family transporter [Sporomusa malonica]|uniref:Permease of the drug/metabolite transporter (DMT) superfamily n=1 Tax=Sporomusa malonica TaxID=112901 RepID=A0A1W2E0F8_9FIRM|nr:EamA family transporter [Sporomusa malonica]SMD03285.1 Permease of the drug/metabolite transporter (DMT) superfamily [Sporomusa malonica]
MYIVYSLMCLIFGTTFLAIKVGIDAGAPPFLFAGTRFFFAGLIVLVTVKILHGKIGLKPEMRKDVALVGIFMTAIMFGCLYWGERYISSSVAALLAATTPIMIAIVEWFQGVRENVWIKGSGLFISFIGVAVAVLPALGIDVTKEAILAVVVILAAEVGCVFGTMTSKKILAAGITSFVLNGWQMVIGGMLLVLLSVVAEPAVVGINDEVAFSWVYLVVLGSLAGHGSYYWLVRRAGPLLPSTWTYISPVIAQFVGYYFLSEYVSVYSFIGLGLVLGGVYLVSKAAALEKWLESLAGVPSKIEGE